MSLKILKEKNNIILDDSLEHEPLHRFKSMLELETFKSVINSVNNDSNGDPIKMFINEFKLPDFLLEMLVRYNTVFNVKPEDLFIRYTNNELKVIINKYELLHVHDEEEQLETTLYKLTKKVFHELINPIVFISTRSTNIKTKELYGIILNRLNALLSNESNQVIRDQLKSVLDWLSEENNEFLYNPFNFQLKEIQLHDGKTAKVRKSCCMRYMMKGQNRCNTCPQKYV